MITLTLAVLFTACLIAFRAMLGDMRAELAEVRDVARPRSTHPGL
jgi:hypothetical protein